MWKWHRPAMLVILALLAAALALLLGDSGNLASQSTMTEKRLRTVLQKIEGVGRVEVLVNEAESGEIIGVCVLTGAADDVSAVFRIQRAVRTALGIENDRIEVIQMEGNGG